MSAIFTARRFFDAALASGRSTLLEHEVYDILDAGGLLTPRRLLVPVSGELQEEDLQKLPGARVMLKLVSPAVTHKTEMGGVAVVEKTAAAVTAAIREMAARVQERGGRTIADSVLGYQLSELIEFQPGLGSELFLGLRNTREFGPCMLMGFGGLDTEALAARFRPGEATVTMPLAAGSPEAFLAAFSRTFTYAKVSGSSRGGKRRISDADLEKLVRVFWELGLGLMPGDGGPAGLLDLEINPFLLGAAGPVAVDGFARIGADFAPRRKPAQAGIVHLLRPERVAIIGVSAKGSNVGRTILGNMLRERFPVGNIRIIKPGGGNIDGAECCDSIAALPWTADLLVVAVSAQQVPACVEEAVACGKVRSMILIPGGMDETAGGKGAAARIRELISSAEHAGRPVPVMVGPNCLGVRSRPGRYDTLFIPEIKFPAPRPASVRNTALVLQSGAFLLTRLNKLPGLDPLYAISTGNQMDLCTSDFMVWLAANAPEVQVIGLYIEGFKDLEGLEAVRAIRAATAAGKTVVAYKAGRTAEGKSATSSHTASMAGDYSTALAALELAGAIVTESFDDFGGLLQLASLLGAKKPGGRRLALVSNAGFETVGMSDNVDSKAGFSLAKPGQETVRRLAGIMEQAGISSLVNIQNPLDLTPMANDLVYAQSVAALAEDPGVDAVVVGLVPFSTLTRTLPPGLLPEDSVDNPESLPNRLKLLCAKCEKPVVAVVDAGTLYDALSDRFLDQGIPVFRTCDSALRCLQKYLASR